MSSTAMSSTFPSSTTASQVLTTSQPLIPLFTPAPSCFSDLWASPAPCAAYPDSGCTSFYFGHNDAFDTITNTCLSASRTWPYEWLPGTACPVSYTPVASSDNVEGWDRHATNVFLTCCPGQYAFTHTSTDYWPKGSLARVWNLIEFCSATGVQMEGRGAPPYTVPFVPSQSEGFGATGTETVLFNPDVATLLAPAVFMSYRITSSGQLTCAPNCTAPYTGGPWPPFTSSPSTPVPPETQTDTESRCNLDCRNAKQLLAVAIAVPVAVVLLMLGCCLWCCVARKRRRLEQEVREARGRFDVVREDRVGGEKSRRMDGLRDGERAVVLSNFKVHS